VQNVMLVSSFLFIYKCLSQYFASHCHLHANNIQFVGPLQPEINTLISEGEQQQLDVSGKKNNYKTLQLLTDPPGNNVNNSCCER
jgi:hypothetical protein